MIFYQAAFRMWNNRLYYENASMVDLLIEKSILYETYSLHYTTGNFGWSLVSIAVREFDAHLVAALQLCPVRRNGLRS